MPKDQIIRDKKGRIVKGVRQDVNKNGLAGRPSVMTPETISKLEHAFGIGCNKKEACAYAEISESTLYDYLATHPDFSDKIERLIQNPILLAKNNIVESLSKRKNETEEQRQARIRNSQWYLSRKKKDEFSNTIFEVKNDNRSIQLVKDDPRVFNTMMEAFENMKKHLKELSDDKV